MVPPRTAPTFAFSQTSSSIFKRGDIVEDFRLEPTPAYSNLCFGDIQCLEIRQHQQRMTQDFAIVQVPEICETSTLLERMSGVVRTCTVLGASLGEAAFRFWQRNLSQVAACVRQSLPPSIAVVPQIPVQRCQCCDTRGIEMLWSLQAVACGTPVARDNHVIERMTTPLLFA